MLLLLFVFESVVACNCFGSLWEKKAPDTHTHTHFIADAYESTDSADVCWLCFCSVCLLLCLCWNHSVNWSINGKFARYSYMHYRLHCISELFFSSSSSLLYTVYLPCCRCCWCCCFVFYWIFFFALHCLKCALFVFLYTLFLSLSLSSHCRDRKNRRLQWRIAILNCGRWISDLHYF